MHTVQKYRTVLCSTDRTRVVKADFLKAVGEAVA